MGFEQDNVYPMLSPTPEIVRFGGYKYSESSLDLISFTDEGIITKSPDCLNVYWREGALWQIDGTEKYEGDVISGAPTVGGLFVYGQESSSTNYVIATTGTKVWRYDGSAWVDITGAYSLGAGQHFGLTFNDDFIGVTANRDAPYKIEGTSNIAALGGSPPNGKVLGRIGEFIVIGNTAANPSYAYYCDPGNPESGWSKFWDVKSDDTQGLTAVGELDQRTGYLFKEFTADRIEHTAGLSFQHDRGYLPKGIVAQATLKKCTVSLDGKAVDVLIGLSNDGVYAFDTSKNPINISQDIAFKFDRKNPFKWNRSHWSKSVAAYDHTRQWYWLFVPGPSSTQNDECWVCDLTTFEWWPHEPGASASICMVNDSNDVPQVHIGGYDGFVRKFDASLKNFDAAAIDAYYNTGVIDFKKTVRLRQFIPYAAQKGNFNLDFRLKWGFSQVTTASDAFLLSAGGAVYATGTYGTAVYGTSRPVYKNLAALNRTGRYLQIEFGNDRVDENFNLFKAEIPGRVIGGRTGDYR
jgi:hypothetical protein